MPKRKKPAQKQTIVLSSNRIMARFDSAQTTPDNQRHWAAADFLAADDEASPEVRSILRRRSRYEIANNSYARGLVLMLANDTIGTGPRLQMLLEDEALNDRIERDFYFWSREIRLAPKLRTMRMARCQDGEAFAVLASNPGLRNNVKLDVIPVEADRVAGELNWREDDTSVDGVRFDAWGNPSSYRVLKYHPGDMRYGTGEEANMIPSANMLHIFRMDRPGLHRGVSELTAALPLFAQLRRYNLAVLSAAEAAADFAAVLYTDAPPEGLTADVEPMDSVPLQRNMMLTIPAGWKLGQLDPKQPAANHAEFVKIVLSEIARCVCCTYGSLSGDFSGYNYSSGRLDNQIYHKSIIVDRSLWESDILDRLFYAWFQEYRVINKLKIEEERHVWFWDGFSHVDPTKDATAQEKHLVNHTTTLAEECAKEGRDYIEVLNQRAKELQLMRKLGITTAEPGKASGKDPETEETEKDEQ